MAELSDRQVKILKTVTEEYIQAAEPVGSEALLEKYNLGVSPATVRNDMAALAREGYLSKPHSSAGRIPTALGFRYYIQNLMNEEPLPVLQEVAIKQRLWPQRFVIERLMREASLALAELTNHLSIVAADDGLVFSAGSVNILDNPEFYDIEVTRSALNLVDNFDTLWSLAQKGMAEDVNLLLAEDLELENLHPCGLIFGRFTTDKRQGIVGVLGPMRVRYSFVIPAIRYFTGLMEEMGRGW